MLQVRHTDMFQSAYAQVNDAERSFIDRLVREIATGAERHGARIADLIDAPLPQELHDLDTRGWLQRPLVLAAVTEKLRDLQLRQDISLDRIVRELHAIATFSLEDIMRYDEFGDPYFDLENATPEQWLAIQSVEVEKSDSLHRSTKTKMKLQTHDKLGAAKMLLELLGGSEADNPYRKADKARNTPALTTDKDAQQLADDYQRYISDD